MKNKAIIRMYQQNSFYFSIIVAILGEPELVSHTPL